MSLIVTQDGVAGLNFEHSWGDGVAVLRYFEDIYKDTTDNSQVNADTSISEVPSDQIKKLSKSRRFIILFNHSLYILIVIFKLVKEMSHRDAKIKHLNEVEKEL